LSSQNNFRNLVNSFRKHWDVLFFLAGFLFDVITIGEVDDRFNLISQGLYLFFACSLLIYSFIDLENNRFKESKIFQLFVKYYDLIFHFSIGSLLSVFTIFYFKSSSILNSFIFLFIIVSFMIANELPAFVKFGKYFKSTLVGICIVSYFSYLSPIFLGEVGKSSFFFGLIISVAFIAILNFVYKKILKRSVLKEFALSSSLACLFFLVFYILKVLPPIPVAIKDIGIYQKIVRSNYEYRCYHQKPWWKFWHKGDQDFYFDDKSIIHLFFAIYSPSSFSDSVIVQWSTKINGKWIKSDQIPVKIVGGRSGGFRGVTYKKNFTAGKWRASVLTKDNREVGSIKMNVIKADSIDRSSYTVDTF